MLGITINMFLKKNFITNKNFLQGDITYFLMTIMLFLVLSI